HAPVGADASGEFSVLGDKLVINADGKDVACYQLDGKLLWKHPLGELAGVAANQNDIGIFSFANPTWLVALDLPSGRELWRTDAQVVTGPIIDRNTIFVGTQTGV